NAVHHAIAPGIINASERSSMGDKEIQRRFGAEFALYFSDEINLGKRLNLMAGLRLSSFALLGPGTFYTYDDDGNISSSKTISGGKVGKTYFRPEPRISASYLLENTSSMKVSYARNAQY